MQVIHFTLVGKRAFKNNYWYSVIVSAILTVVMGGMGRASSTGSNTETITINIPNDLPNMPRDTVMAITTISLIGLILAVLIRVFIYNPFEVGCNAFFKENVLTGEARLEEVAKGFRRYDRTFITLLLRDLFTALWAILLVIPGIMKAYSYRLVPYLLDDEPELSPSEVLELSERMMKGSRMKAFLLDLSFIGWYFLVGLTFGIAGIF